MRSGTGITLIPKIVRFRCTARDRFGHGYTFHRQPKTKKTKDNNLRSLRNDFFKASNKLAVPPQASISPEGSTKVIVASKLPNGAPTISIKLKKAVTRRFLHQRLMQHRRILS